MARAIRHATAGVTIVVSRVDGETGETDKTGEAGMAGGPFDLTAVHIAAGAGQAVAWALERRARNPGEEVVFFCEDVRVPELAAIRSLGITPIAAGTGSGVWLVGAAPTLIRVARARHHLRTAELAVPRFVPSADDLNPGVPLPMPVAEQRFRETYLRGLVAGAGNRARAAAHAGIPYRTLCKALQTLEIPVPTSPPAQFLASQGRTPHGSQTRSPPDAHRAHDENGSPFFSDRETMRSR